MRKNKNGFFKTLSKGWQKSEKELIMLKTKTPTSYLIFWNMFMFMVIVIVSGVLFYEYLDVRTIPFEVEGSCNTGFIGIEYKAKMDNQPYATLDKIYDGSNPQDFRLVKHTRYFVEYLPKELNLKNIDGLNCNFKVKGAIPLNRLQELS